jgi:hypothetical protein
MSEAINAQALVEKGALINQVSMYVLYGDIDIPERESLMEQHAAAVARKLYQSEVPYLSALKSIPEAQKEADLTLIRQAAGAVSNVETLSRFMRFADEINSKYDGMLVRQLGETRAQVATWNWIYFGLYMIGGAVLFLGGIQQVKLAQRRDKDNGKLFPRKQPGGAPAGKRA